MPKTTTEVPEPADPPRRSGRRPDGELEEVTVDDEEESPKRAGLSREERDRLDGRGRSPSKRRDRKDRPRRRSKSKGDDRRKHRPSKSQDRRREESLDSKHGTTKCNTCGQRVGGGAHGYETHCKTSKYHMAWDFYLRGLAWNQAQARAHKVWTSWYGTPPREPRERTTLRSRDRSDEKKKSRKHDRSRSPKPAPPPSPDRSRSTTKAAKRSDRSRPPKGATCDRSRSAKLVETKPKERARSSGVRRRAATPQPSATTAAQKIPKKGETAPKAEPEESGSYYSETAESSEAEEAPKAKKAAKAAKAASTEGPSKTQLESMAQLYEANASFLRTMTGAKR